MGQLMSTRKQVGYVTPEQSKKRNAEHEKTIMDFIEQKGEVTTVFLVGQGIDVSVVRRMLVDMRERGLITMKLSGNPAQRIHCYSKAPPRIMRQRWVSIDNGIPLGQHHRNTL